MYIFYLVPPEDETPIGIIIGVVVAVVVVIVIVGVLLLVVRNRRR